MDTPDTRLREVIKDLIMNDPEIRAKLQQVLAKGRFEQNGTADE